MINRILIAIPGIALAIAAVLLGNPVFAIVVGLIAMVALHEYLNLLAAIAPVRWAAFAGAALTIALPAILDLPERGILVGAAAAVILAAVGGLLLADRTEVTIRVALTAFGAIWIGVPMGLMVALREFEFGASAIANILVGTWAFDTFSYFGGRFLGRHPVAPRTSPKKTVEGLVIGVIGGTLAVAVAGLYMDWIDAPQSLLLGAIICVVAYVGDLFESLIKRDIEVKDTSRLLGEHGGVLDRFDAILFTAVVGYFATIWLVT